MKIGIDASRYSSKEVTGVEYYSQQIIDGLLKLILKDGKDEVILYSRKKLKLPKGVKQTVLKAKRFWTLRALSREMRIDPPDVLFVPSHVLPLRRPYKSVITIHDVAFRSLKGSYSFLQYYYLNWSTKYAVRHATKIIVPSEATREDLKKFFKCPDEKIIVIPHGFSAPKVKKGKKSLKIFKYFDINKDMKYVLFVGRLETKKNILRLLKAFAKFRKKHSDFWMILAGKRGVGFNKIQKKANKGKLMEHVIMPGYVTEEEKAKLYKECEMVAIPSLYEGFGFPVQEAFYYKKPVLTSFVSSLIEVAQGGAYYCDPNDVESIAAGMEKFTTDKKYAKKLVEIGSKQLKTFSWVKASKKTLWTIKK